MADATRQQLRQAFQLIKDKRRAEAVQILQPIVQADPANKDAWWLLANAATDPNQARSALHNVLRLEPDHEKAQRMLAKINERYPPPAPEPEPVPEPDSFDFGGGDDDPFAAMASGDAFGAPAQAADDPFGAPAQSFGGSASASDDPFGAPAQSFGGPASASDDPFGAPAQSFGAPATAQTPPSDDPFGGPVGSPSSTARKPSSSGGGMSSGTRTLLIVLAVIGGIAVCGCLACWGLAQAGIASIASVSRLLRDWMTLL